MQKSFIDISQSEFYPKIIRDYLMGSENLKPFYNYFPALPSFKSAISDLKKIKFNRKLLVEVLSGQNYEMKNQTANIQLLLSENSFTVCTGHQLCLFTGPLYFIYKLITTINLSEQLKINYPGFNFIPVFWMATEDHDFEEINHVNIYGKKLIWNHKQGGPAGKYDFKGIEEMLSELKIILGENENAAKLLQIFSSAYSNKKNLAEATRYLVNEILGKSGLVIIDGNDKRLKNEFSDIISDDIFNNTNFRLVNETIADLNNLSYKHQVNPREINLFYLSENNRNRIEKNDLETNLNELKLKLETGIGNFSPNVVLRPLFQQKILPNVSYVGGPNEIAYWLEFKKMFDHHGIYFPMLLLRNSALWIDERSGGLMKKNGIGENEIFENADSIIKKVVERKSGGVLHLGPEKENLKKVFADILIKAEKEDASLKPSVEAELQKIFHYLETLENKMVKAGKQKNESTINQVKKIKEKFFPENKLQERYDNFIPYYLKYGENFINILKKNLDPFENRLLILREDTQ